MPMNDNGGPSNATDPAYGFALEAKRSELAAMPDEEILRDTKLDPTVAADVVEASAIKIVSHRAAIVALFGAKAGELIDELPIVARATKQADIEHARAQPTIDAAGMHKEVLGAHQLLMTDAQALANRKLIDARALEPARDTQGYQATLRSVLVLVSLLREAWPRIHGISPLKKEDIDNAERVAQHMSTALARRDHGVDKVPAAELRTRALSMLVHRYSEVRRIMTYLRWHQGDADTFAPSLWAGRGRRTRGDGPAVGGDEPTEPTPAVTDGPAAPAPIVDPTDGPAPINGGGAPVPTPGPASDGGPFRA